MSKHIWKEPHDALEQERAAIAAALGDASSTTGSTGAS